ncbi:hypothetical protein K438DRAFT_1961742 [Mycena galopus ATCC 62051]|nr:hypothetical protein K438DRAFT_1961742 [Mycena galopus ATCC 62051]
MSHTLQPSATPQMSEHRPEAKPSDSVMKTVEKKFAGSAASKAGEQTEEYVKDNHSELEAKGAQEYDDAKAQAQAQLDEAKQASRSLRSWRQPALTVGLQTWSKIFPCC